MVFPYDAITIHHELVGPQNFTALNSGITRYILGVSIQQSGTASQTSVFCGSQTVAINYGKDLPYNNLSYKCSDSISMSKTGQDSSSIIITYVNRDLSTLDATASAVFPAPAFSASIYDFASTTYVFWILVLIVISYFVGQSIYRR